MDVSQAQRSTVTIQIIDAAKKQWWKNFWHEDPVFYSELQMLEVELAKHNCRYVRRMWPHSDLIEFDTEQDYVMFVLRWS